MSFLLGSIFLTSCSPHRFSTEQASQHISEALGCDDFQSQVFDAIYEVIDQDRKPLKFQEIENKIDKNISKLLAEKNFNSRQVNLSYSLNLKMKELIKTLLQQMELHPELNWKAQIQSLIEYEMQDMSSENIIETHKKINKLTAEITQLSSDLNISCGRTTTTTPSLTPIPNEQPIEVNSQPANGLFHGMNRIFATAYQSCDVLNLPDLDSKTPAVQGITILSEMHSDNIGRKRVISSLPAVIKTHYYLKDSKFTDNHCLSIKNNPLIYDYGGEPAITQGALNLFLNAGSGTKVLGIDCSAYVMAGILAGGIKYKAKVPNKAIFVRQNSSKFINAQTSGFDCFENISVWPENSINVGDIVAVKGHTLTIDKVGKDPFGLSEVTTISDCSQLNFKKFDITIAQSSPSKNGIGINKYKVNDYLTESVKMRTAFLQMGYYSCIAKFKNQKITPINTEWGFIRHKKTQECLANTIPIVGQECVKSCW
ncbi:MAG: hypothetical protein HUU56_08145 [Bdellovibrionaceae bacterium]|nr:hypothetical protein [Pseudobdellovibrionaceae bacterium]